MKKNKLFLCFRPFPIETEQRQPGAAAVCHGGGGGGSSYTVVSRERNPNASAIKSPVLDIESRSNKSGRSFSRILKSILFEASLKQRVRDKNSEELIRRSRKIDKYSRKSNGEFAKPNLSRTSSMVSSSSSSNSIRKTEKYRSESCKDKKQSNYWRLNSNTVVGSSNSYSGLYLILITLCITILCGRVYGILLMSLWVCCNPRRRRSERKVGLPETEEEVEYEKRLVIMEGLIERNHHTEAINVLRETEFSRV